MNVSLTPELKRFVADEVKSGFYRTASEVIGAGLRRLREEKRARLPAVPKTRAELEAELLQSVERFDRGEGVNGDAIFEGLRSRIRESQPRGQTDC